MVYCLGVVIGLKLAKDTTVHARVSDEHSIINLTLRMLNWSVCSKAFEHFVPLDVGDTS